MLCVFEGTLQHVSLIGNESTVDHFPDIGSCMGSIFLLRIPLRLCLEDIFGAMDNLSASGHTNLTSYIV